MCLGSRNLPQSASVVTLLHKVSNDAGPNEILKGSDRPCLDTGKRPTLATPARHNTSTSPSAPEIHHGASGINRPSLSPIPPSLPIGRILGAALLIRFPRRFPRPVRRDFTRRRSPTLPSSCFPRAHPI